MEAIIEKAAGLSGVQAAFVNNQTYCIIRRAYLKAAVSLGLKELITPQIVEKLIQLFRLEGK